MIKYVKWIKSFYPFLYLSPHHTHIYRNKQTRTVKSLIATTHSTLTHTSHNDKTFLHSLLFTLLSATLTTRCERKTMATGSDEEQDGTSIHQTPLRIPELLYVSVKMENPIVAVAGNLFPHVFCSSALVGACDSSRAVNLIRSWFSVLLFFLGDSVLWLVLLFLFLD